MSQDAEHIERIREWRDENLNRIQSKWRDIDALLNEIDRLRDSSLLFRTLVPSHCFVCGESFDDVAVCSQVDYSRDRHGRKDISWRFWHVACDERAMELLGDE